MRVINVFLLLCLVPLGVASQYCGLHEAYINCSTTPAACFLSHSYSQCGGGPCLLNVSYGTCIDSDHYCSAFGTADAHCDVGCQEAFGRCLSHSCGLASKPSFGDLGWTLIVIAMLAGSIAYVALCFLGLPYALVEMVDCISRYQHPYHWNVIPCFDVFATLYTMLMATSSVNKSSMWVDVLVADLCIQWPCGPPSPPPPPFSKLAPCCFILKYEWHELQVLRTNLDVNSWCALFHLAFSTLQNMTLKYMPLYTQIIGEGRK